MIVVRRRLRYLQTLDEFLVISPSSALPISYAFNGMTHLEEVLDVPRGHLRGVPYLLSLSIPLIVRLGVLMLLRRTDNLIRSLTCCAVILR